jgi:hypothetical protein
MKILACNIHNIFLTKANVILHPWLVLHCIEDRLGNNVKWFKDWYETMFNHTNVCTKRCHELLIKIKGPHTKLWASKVMGVPILGISRLPLGNPKIKMTFGCWRYD